MGHFFKEPHSLTIGVKNIKQSSKRKIKEMGSFSLYELWETFSGLSLLF